MIVMTMVLLTKLIKPELRVTMMMIIMMLAGCLSNVHVFTLFQMERDRQRGRTPAVRGTLAPRLVTTRVRTPATAGRTSLQ